MARVAYLCDASTDPGHVRRRNEDAVYADNALGIYFVVDGMGGQAAGQEAARIATMTLKGRLERPSGTPERRIRESIALANNAIHEAAQQTPAWQGMGCVLTVALVEEGKLHYGHVGDTRLYKIRGGEIRKITNDHSPVGEREDAREIGEREAMQHPRRNEVYRDVGVQPRDPDEPLFIDTGVEEFENDAAFLLCSDGLSDVLTREEIRVLIEESAGNPKLVTGRLIEAASETGTDNISAVYLEGPAFARRPATGEDTEKWRAPAGTEKPGLFRRMVPLMSLIVAFLLGIIAQRQMDLRTAPRKLQVAPGFIPSIAEALEQAREGDQILIAPGDYREQIRLKNGVDLIGSHAALLGQTGSQEAAITAENISRARVSGLSIRSDSEAGYQRGIVVRDSDVDLEAVEVSGAHFRAIEFSGRSKGRLASSRLHDNPGTAVVVEGDAAPLIENCLFVNNGLRKETPYPAVEWRSAARLTLHSNAFGASGAESVWVIATPEPTLELNNLFTTERRVRLLKVPR